MDHVVKGVLKFKEEVFPSHRELFGKLATGQSPDVLFITCSDSRIDPNLVTQAMPGALFICRNAGNIVPPHVSRAGGVTASIEFAVAALGVRHVVVCGHTDCGAMKGALDLGSLDALPHIREWLDHSRAAVETVSGRHGSCGVEHLEELTRENVVSQLQNLRTHPSVASRERNGKLQLHGWVYDIETGDVICVDESSGGFLPIEQRYAQMIEESSDAHVA